jgi:integrase
MVGKRKNPRDSWLPPRVYRGRSSYEYKPKGGGTVALCKLGDETEALKAEVWKKYAQAKESPQQDNVNKLIDHFHKSAQFERLGFRTKQDYLRYSKTIRNVFGEMLPHEVIPHDIRNFMDAYADNKNLKGNRKEVTANRHHSYLSVLFSYGVQYNWLSENPAKSVRKFPEKPRDRYIEDHEYNLVFSVAANSGYPYVAQMMEIAYLCRARSQEVLALNESDLLDDGVFIDRGKGSINEITAWSPRLEAAISEARAMNAQALTSITRPIFRARDGLRIRREAFKTAWGRIMKQAESAGLQNRFKFHDVKAKGISDHAKKAGGHKTKKMQAVYDRKPGITEPTR